MTRSRDSTKARRITVDTHKQIDANGKPYMLCQCGRGLRPSCMAVIDLTRPLDKNHQWRAHHVILWADGGEDTPDNLVPIRVQCDVQHTAPEDVSRHAKNKNIRETRLGIKKSRTPMPFGRNSRFKKKISGEIVER